ncbi:hypothetical protein CO674_30290 [Rhizobium hidalgonense]|uniref:Uncharacterized protein n=1 Tax=Rhizobium hidalgonense TaxID=1538159 RepID=A0ABX4JLK3_9HYPH|nr:hypothetical protein CO674_30290 [Rhizobium hidalgonense]PON05757.1 hypothetical protein ATY29_19710 [Rhizobium hidalgonense]
MKARCRARTPLNAFSGAVVIVGGIVLVIEVAFDLDAWRSLPPVPHLEDDDLVLADLIVDKVSGAFSRRQGTAAPLLDAAP